MHHRRQQLRLSPIRDTATIHHHIQHATDIETLKLSRLRSPAGGLIVVSVMT